MSNSFQILFISENVELQVELRKNLARLGCKVKCAMTAEIGIEELKKMNYDAVFADLCVREKGGRSVARWVKNESIKSKVFIVTSWKGELDPNLLRLDGIHAVIHKPFIFSEIRDKILEHIG
jgi:DNA-binding response OmpR family regulator